MVSCVTVADTDELFAADNVRLRVFMITDSWVVPSVYLHTVHESVISGKSRIRMLMTNYVVEPKPLLHFYVISCH